MIAEPPVVEGADHDTATDESPRTTDTSVGAPGVTKGTTEFEIEYPSLQPISFLAQTRKV